MVKLFALDMHLLIFLNPGDKKLNFFADGALKSHPKLEKRTILMSNKNTELLEAMGLLCSA